MKEKIILEVEYNELVNRQAGLNQMIMANQIEDPKNEDISKREQNLINLGAMQMISEIIDKYPQTTKQI